MFEETSGAVLKKLTVAHLPQALALSSALGWPYRLEDWAFAHSLGDGLALEHGQLVGTAMRWDYGGAFASVGMIIVATQCKGRGYGARLVDALLDGAGSRNIFLNSTAEALELYRRRGFVPTGTLNQHQGVFVAAGERPGLVEPIDSHIKSAADADLPEIIKLDEAALGMPRPELLKRIAEVGQLTVLSRGGSVTGYAACRAFGKGHVIGPVIAPDVDAARVLIAFCRSCRRALCGWTPARIPASARGLNPAAWPASTQLPKWFAERRRRRRSELGCLRSAASHWVEAD